MKYDKTKKAYDEIISVMENHKDLCNISISEIEERAKCHLFAIELKEKYGIVVPKNVTPSIDYMRLGVFIVVARWGEKYNRAIVWEDNGKQPIDEYLVEISFPTGAYVFGEDYPKDDFQDMFLELRDYGAKYVDSMNHSLYYVLDNAADVINDFQKIFDKHYQIYKSKSKEREIQRLKKRIEELSKS